MHPVCFEGPPESRESLNQHHRHESRVSRNLPWPMGNMISIRKGRNLHTPHEGTISGSHSGLRKPKRPDDVLACRWPPHAAIRARIVSKAQALIRSPGDSVAEDSSRNPRLSAYAPNRYPIRSHGDVHPRNRRRDWTIIGEFSARHNPHHQSHPLPLMLDPD